MHLHFNLQYSKENSLLYQEFQNHKNVALFKEAYGVKKKTYWFFDEIVQSLQPFLHDFFHFWITP